MYVNLYVYMYVCKVLLYFGFLQIFYGLQWNGKCKHYIQTTRSIEKDKKGQRVDS